LFWPSVVLLPFAPLCGQAAIFECLIQPNQIVEMRTPEIGLIGKVHVQRGDSVKAGQVLFELESSAELAAIETAKYRSEMNGRIAVAQQHLDAAVSKYGRVHELQRNNFVSAQARDDGQAEMLVAKAELEDASENHKLAELDYQHALQLLNLRTLRSPFEGVVVDRMMNTGELTQNGIDAKPIVKLAQIDPLRVEVVLPVEYYRKLNLGMTGEIIPEGLGVHRTATIKVIDRIFDAASGTFGVRLELQNHDRAIPGGIRCQVEFAQLKPPERKTPASK
jgi:RND family efflux transporter MFP subunit